jgi:predicted HTH domain antitoxin
MSTPNSIQINLRVPKKIASDLDALAVRGHITRIDAARQILFDGIEQRKRALALDLYRNGKLSKSKAAEIAGISLWEMIDLVAEDAVPSPYTLEEAVSDVRRLIAQTIRN